MSEENANNKGVQETKGISIPARWGPSKEASTIYANQLYISHAGNEFYLIFGEANPLTRTSEEEDLPEYIEIQPVVKIAVSPPNMLRFAEALADNVRKFMDKRTLPIETADEGIE